MNKTIAISILETELDRFFEKSQAELESLIGKEPYTAELLGSDGIEYQIEVQCFWDDTAGGDIRLIGSVDDGGIRAYFPITRGRLKLAD